MALTLVLLPANAQAQNPTAPKPFDKGTDRLPEPPAKLPNVHADRTRGLDFLFGALKAAVRASWFDIALRAVASWLVAVALMMAALYWKDGLFAV